MVTYCCYFKYRGAISGSSQGGKNFRFQVR